MSQHDLPETPVGERLSQLIASLSAPEGITEDQVTELFHPGFVRALGNPEAVVGILEAWADRFAPFQIEVIEEKSNATGILAEITNPEGLTVLLSCEVDHADGHQITGLITRPKPRDITSLDEVDELLSYHGAPGLSLAVVIDAEISLTRAWGVTDTSSPSPITPNTIIQCGSISKAVAALAALRLVDQGVLDLDADVNEALTSWKAPAVGDWQPIITLRQLLTHTAGLTIWGFQGYPSGTPIPTLVDVLNGSGNTPPIRSEALPGLMWRYSGGGFTVLQQLMIDVTGQSFPEILHDLVLEPLGMSDSSYEQPIPGSLEDRAATGHQGGQPVEGRWHNHPEMAAAGLWTTPSDLARYLIGVAAGRSGQPDALLSKQTATQMFSPPAMAPSMGLGVFFGGSGAVRTFGHGGANAGFTGRLISTDDASLGLVALTNSNEGIAAATDVFQFLAKEHGNPELLAETSKMGEEALAGMARAVPIEHKEPADVPQSAVESYLGVYDTDSSSSIRVEKTDGWLSLTVDGQSPLPLYPHSPVEWVSKAIDVRVVFEGKGLELHQLGRTVEAKKVE